MGINEKLDNDIKEALLEIPHVRESVVAFSRINNKTVDAVLDLIVARVRVTNLPRVRRQYEQVGRDNPIKMYAAAAREGIVKDPVIK